MRTSSVAALCLPLAAIGIAVARGRKEEPPVTAPSAPTEVATEAVPPPAPPLFDKGLPVVIASLPAGLASLSAQGCNACHYAAHDTWQRSAHADAWLSPRFQAAWRSAGESTTCVSCHLPVAAQHDRLAAGYIDGDTSRPRLEANPSFDATLRSEGVTCAGCHVRDGVIHGTVASTNAPHAVLAAPELGTPEFCATCHQLTWPEGDRPFYDTYGEWQASSWAAAGVTCQDCHMAPTAGAVVPGTDGTVASHALTGELARALSVLLTLPSSVVQRGQAVDVGITIQNTGAGHSFPTGNPFGAATLTVALVDSAGKELAPPWTTTWSRTVEMAPPWKTTADHRLAAGGQENAQTQFVPSAKGAIGIGAFEVRLVRGDDSVVLSRVPVDVR